MSQDRIVGYCSAGCLLLSRDLFLKIGGFKYLYESAYHEDPDLRFKIAACELLVAYCNPSRVVRIGNATSSTHRQSLGITNIIEVNRGQFLRRWGACLAARDAEALRERPALPCPGAHVGGRLRTVFCTPFTVTPGGGDLIAALAKTQQFDGQLVLEEPASISASACWGR